MGETGDFQVKYYPIYLNIKEKHCVVIGGGSVAERKVNSLLDAGAKVTVISPEITHALEDLRSERRITVVSRPYHEGDLEGALIAYAATDNEDINKEISKEAKSKGVLLNIVDEPKRCDFIVPSVVERGRLSIAVSTGGASPALAKELRAELEERYGEEYATFLEIMAAIRQKLLTKERESDKNRKIFNKLASSSIPEMIKKGEWQEVDRTIISLAGKDFSLASLGIEKA